MKQENHRREVWIAFLLCVFVYSVLVVLITWTIAQSRVKSTPIIFTMPAPTPSPYSGIYDSFPVPPKCSKGTMTYHSEISSLVWLCDDLGIIYLTP